MIEIIFFHKMKSNLIKIAYYLIKILFLHIFFSQMHIKMFK